jgi:hypothetical protein
LSPIIAKKDQVDILKDYTWEKIEENLPIVVKEYINEKRSKLQNSYAYVDSNRGVRMRRAKLNYDRRLRRAEYKIGDWVLVHRPQLKKGMSRGLAPRYYGPFIVVGIHANKFDYLIKLANQPGSRAKMVHVNNLKIFHRGMQPTKTVNIETLDTPAQAAARLTKRSYNKDINNPYWQEIARKKAQSNRENGGD